jgi:hypothetical protein
MEKNMGNVDRLIRSIVAVVITFLYITGLITDTLAIVLGIVAIVFLLTSVVGFCPLYKLLGISTNKSK